MSVGRDMWVASIAIHVMVVAVWLNNDTGDSWEWADSPSYPEAWSALGFRIMLNHIVYAMTH